MTKFDELQQTHQHLLDRMDEAADKAAFVREVQDYVSRVCDQAVDVPAPRERDQLRANLRYWASYLYDATGTYPNTTLRPARPAAEMPETVAPPPEVPAQTVPPPQAPATPMVAPRSSTAAPGWRILLLAGIVVILFGVMFFGSRLSQQSGAAPSPGRVETVQPGIAQPGQTLTLTWRVVTAGPSPYNPGIWVARIELSATGGNNEFIFWVNGQHLPEASNDQFTVESQGCQPVSQYIGVTSGGQSARQELVIYPPESKACSR